MRIPAVEAGLMAMVFSNASQAMPPWGSKQMLLGTNPFCMAAPGGPAPADHPRHVAGGGGARQDPHAPSAAAKTFRSAMRSTPTGRPTTDPKAALAGGVVLPIGEHKGSGIAMFMDIFGGVISGANFGGEVGDQYKSFDRAQDVGHFFLAMKPNLFVSEDDYRARIDTLIDRIKAVAARRRLLPRCWCRASPRTATRRERRKARHSLCRERGQSPAGRSQTCRHPAAGGGRAPDRDLMDSPVDGQVGCGNLHAQQRPDRSCRGDGT